MTSLPPLLPLPPPPPPGFINGQSPPTFYEEPQQLPLAVLPGDDLTRFILKKDDAPRKSKPPKIGTGLAIVPTSSRRRRRYHQQEDDMDITINNNDDSRMNINNTDEPSDAPSFSIIAIIAGRLVHHASNSTDTYYISSNTQRYIPTLGDRVIGIVEDTTGEYYRVNILGGHSALLHNLNFEGASKRNRPRLDPGSLVYCRVVRGVDDGVKVVGSSNSSGRMVGGRVDPEVSCKVGGGGGGSSSIITNAMDDDGGATRKDWTTSECTYGPLSSSTSSSFRVSLGLARSLLLPTNETLSALSKSKVPFEICIGVNGLIWVDAPAPEIVIMVQNAIKNGEVVGRGMVGGMVKSMVKNLRTQMEE